MHRKYSEKCTNVAVNLAIEYPHCLINLVCKYMIQHFAYFTTLTYLNKNMNHLYLRHGLDIKRDSPSLLNSCGLEVKTNYDIVALKAVVAQKEQKYCQNSSYFSGSDYEANLGEQSSRI